MPAEVAARPSPSGGVRVGVVGAGWAAREHCRSVVRSGLGTVTAVHDTDPAQAASLARDTGARSCPTLETLLEHDLDAVIVATPPGSHRAPVVAALERGRAVFVEKPLARTLADGRAIVAAADAARTPCAVGYQWRAVGALDALDADLRDTRVLTLLSLGVGISQRRSWYRDAAESSGLIGERASHHIDLQRRIAGEVVSVQASDSRSGRTDADDGTESLAVVLRYASGAVGTVGVTEVDARHPSVHRTEVVSDEHTHELLLDPAFTLRRDGSARAAEPADGWTPSERQIVAFLGVVAADGAGTVTCTAADALGTLEVVVAAEASLASGAATVVGGDADGRPAAGAGTAGTAARG